MAGGTGTVEAPGAILEFADLALDTRQRAVFRGDARLPLPRLTYALLQALAAASPGLLCHDDIAERVWGGRPVSPETIAQRVLLLRRALDDDAVRPRYLRVVRGVGVQLVPPVRVRPTAPARPASTAGGAVAPVGHPPWRHAGPDLSLPAQPSIVVLPFDSDGGPEPLRFAHGLTHDLITQLGRTRSFFVIARGTAFRFGGGPHDVRNVAHALGVRYAVQGNLRFSGAALRINVALADALEGRELWAECLQRPVGDVFELQQELIDLIAGEIGAEVEFSEQQRACLQAPASLDAWSAFHRGCWHMYRFNAADYVHARRFFERALELDPRFSRALAGLSFVHWQQAFLGIAPDRAAEVRRAFECARQSVALDARDPLGRWALGRAHLLLGEVDRAVDELDAATAINPSFAVGQYSLGFALMQAGELARGVERADRARRLSPCDPLGFAMIGVRGFSLALEGAHAEAAHLMEAVASAPNVHHHAVAMAAVCDALAGREDEARRNRGRVLAAQPGYDARAFLHAFRFQRPNHRAVIEDAFARLARLD